jgi:hypothetical protein
MLEIRRQKEAAGSDPHSQNKGTSHDVVENKGREEGVVDEPQNVAENKALRICGAPGRLILIRRVVRMITKMKGHPTMLLKTKGCEKKPAEMQWAER